MSLLGNITQIMKNVGIAAGYGIKTAVSKAVVPTAYKVKTAVNRAVSGTGKTAPKVTSAPSAPKGTKMPAPKIPVPKISAEAEAVPEPKAEPGNEYDKAHEKRVNANKGIDDAGRHLLAQAGLTIDADTGNVVSSNLKLYLENRGWTQDDIRKFCFEYPEWVNAFDISEQKEIVDEIESWEQSVDLDNIHVDENGTSYGMPVYSGDDFAAQFNITYDSSF